MNIYGSAAWTEKVPMTIHISFLKKVISVCHPFLQDRLLYHDCLRRHSDQGSMLAEIRAADFAI